MLTLTDHERAEFARAAQALYGSGKTAAGSLLAAVSATGGNSLAQIDRAFCAYSTWLVFGADAVDAVDAVIYGGAL